MDTVETLVADLLVWLGTGPRPYRDVHETWRTSCPKLPVWEDAVDAGFLEFSFEQGHGRMVRVSSLGTSWLHDVGRAEAPTASVATVPAQVDDQPRGT